MKYYIYMDSWTVIHMTMNASVLLHLYEVEVGDECFIECSECSHDVLIVLLLRGMIVNNNNETFPEYVCRSILSYA